MARAAVRGSTELREVAYAFNEMAHDLEQAETLRRNLVADVAHELRTPLSVLRANLQALVDGIYPLERSEIDKLLDQTELLNRLVDELRELSLAEARQLPLQQTAFDLNELMSLIVETFQPTVQKRGLSLDLRLPSEIIRFTGDRGRIQQVLNNLIQNAITHTPPGGKVHLTLSQDQGHIHLMVQDTGEGIPARHLPHVFDRFYRVDYSRSRETGGTGLGLAIAKAIIELHDGEIQVMSDGLLGSGSTFTISLPRSER
jgi:signal transduction histidine kinase